jgi:hypothetical protein
MRIHFMNMKTGEIYAVSSAVRVENGKLVPDSLGLPPVKVGLNEDDSLCGSIACDECVHYEECE